MSREKITQQQLEKVVGGYYTPEALTWVQTHYELLFSRAKSIGKEMDLNYYLFYAIHEGEVEFSVSDLKGSIAEMGISCSDLE